MSLFNFPFLRCFTPAHFHNTPCWKNALPFFRQSLIRESFSRFLLRYNFSPFLNECPLFISKDFVTSLLTLFGVSLVLWRRERQITSIATPFYCPLSPNSQTSAFLIYSCYTFRNFVRSRRDWEKKCWMGIRQSPYRSRTMFCFTMPFFTPSTNVNSTEEQLRRFSGS